MNARLSALLAERAASPPGAPQPVHLAEVLQLYQARALTTPAEQLAAATLLVESPLAAEVEAAQTLALGVMASGVGAAARVVAATAYDRLRMLAGKPQKFGTQVVVREGRRELWPVDGLTTDSERAKWGLPGLGELERRGLGG